MSEKRRIASVVEIILGLVLLVLGTVGVLDEYWSGMGAGLLVVGIVQTLRMLRYKTNSRYKEKVDVETNDERNRFLAGKAWSMAGFVYIIAAALASVVFKLIGNETLMFAASSNVCLILIIYWISYFCLRGKY